MIFFNVRRCTRVGCNKCCSLEGVLNRCWPDSVSLDTEGHICVMNQVAVRCVCVCVFVWTLYMV